MTPARPSTLDVAAVERATGWRVVAFARAGSTNDEAARIRDAVGRDEMPADRVAVVADEQIAGRGRGGHAFSSPLGGLYASLLLRVPADDLPAPLVFASAVALAEAVESTTSLRPRIKWPNDLWLGARKFAGILVEAAGTTAPTPSAIVGVGVNLRAVPGDLPPDVARSTTALDREAGRPTPREALLARLLERVDHWRTHLRTSGGRASLEAAYRERLALRGAPVRFLVGDEERRGVLRDVSLERGVLIEESAASAEPAGPLRQAQGKLSSPGTSAPSAAAWRSAAHVREMRPDRR